MASARRGKKKAAPSGFMEERGLRYNDGGGLLPQEVGLSEEGVSSGKKLSLKQG